MNWHRSLYWRIALGVVAFLAVMLVVQAVLFVWVIGQSGRTLPGQSPTRFAQMIALDVTNTLERDPAVDLDHYLHEQYSQYTHPFFVVLGDGRTIAVGDTIPSPATIEGARMLLHRSGFSSPVRGRGQMPPAATSAADPPAHDPTDGVLDPFRPMPIVLHGQLAGMVVVAQRAPFTSLLTRFAPMLGVVAGIVLVVGAVVTSALTFGPPRRRLRALEIAARRLGTGDLSARAPQRGGDEIAAVATAFNAMASDLSARAEALALSDRTRRQLLADVSHELNTPITAMRGYIETMRMPDMSIDEETRDRYLSIISDETARLERLVGDLLDLARIEGGGSQLLLSDVHVSELFSRVAARHERACQLAGVTLVERIDPGAEIVRSDRERLERALQNLAANAMRYAPNGSTLILSSRLGVDGLSLSVEDQGAGIAPAHLPHIFDRFYKADASRQDTSGSGLGLSIVKAIVEQHGARISVESRPGRTTFDIAGLTPGTKGPQA